MLSVLITRPDYNDATCAFVSGLGFQPIVAPFLEIQRFAASLPGRVQALVVTSSNALPALPTDAAPVLTVGDATAARARAQGFGQVTSAGGDAAALAALVSRVADPAGAPLFLASGAGQGQALAQDLRRRGFRVIRRVCYAARPVQRFPQAAEQALRSGRLHAALFLSAETAATFVRLLPPGFYDMLRPVAALAIGQTTASALEPLPWLRIDRASAPTLEKTLALL